MNTFTREQFDAAVAQWITSCSDFYAITKIIPTNHVFTFDAEQMDWMRNLNRYKEFCTEIGVYKGQLVAILCPLDGSGKRLVVDKFPYSPLQELDRDLRLMETEEYIVVKNAVLSKDLQRIDDNSDTYLPVSSKPMLEQDKAVTAIESWRDEAMIWFYRECTEFKGSRIFKRFFVPTQDITATKSGFTHVVCSFGLKFSDVYQRLLPTLIFISFYEDLQNSGSVQTISNTYDWSEACPPLCK
ncbi:hypothetical protein MKJ01_00635 [Chryseobacterium sp. SSA4.19]|uniref:hypothetical protein n=1 Tax=Chryseobacterium sp. SSA4.19 TaxID=2919915 RepID=UPI001F4E5DE0|nr:hypothetical protein [Chryseobacterium sp. SSA4.19]MCJ8152262.1 hypothetical protein [Chryseobacterium sp. SSA4.19]